VCNFTLGIVPQAPIVQLYAIRSVASLDSRSEFQDYARDIRLGDACGAMLCGWVSEHPHHEHLARSGARSASGIRVAPSRSAFTSGDGDPFDLPLGHPHIPRLTWSARRCGRVG